MVRIGIIGVGNMGSKYLDILRSGKIDGAEVTALYVRNKQKASDLNESVSPQIKVYTDLTALYASGDVDAVIITTPHYFHVEMSMQAFAYGLHVLCEKPSGVYTKEVQALNDCAAQSGKAFALIYNQRTNPLYIKIREIIQSGQLGAIKRTNWMITDWYRSQCYYDAVDWRATWRGEGGGVLINQCIHNLDLWQWICGMPTAITAFCHEGKWHDIEVEDDVTAYVAYANGATGVFVTSTGDAPGTNRLEISCDRGKLVTEQGKLLVYTLEQSEREFNKTNQVPMAKPAYTVEEIQIANNDHPYEIIISNFVNHIAHGEPLIAEGQEGILGLTLSNGMHLSSWTGKTIHLPIDEQLFLDELNKKRDRSISR